MVKIKNYALIVLVSGIFAAGCGGGGGSDGCGGVSGKTCEEGQFCKYEDFSCGASGTEGVCTDIPVGDCSQAVASTIEGAVCSCDRLDFHNECWAEQAGQSLQGAGVCP